MSDKMQHEWVHGGHDSIGNAIRKCARSGCTARKIANCSTFWQKAPRGHWRDEENEEIPPCGGKRP